MLIEIIIHQCPHCKSKNIVKNGHTQYGSQRCLCHDCGRTRVLIPRRMDKPERIKQLLRALRERCSLRGIARIFNVSLKTLLFLIAYLGQKLPAMRTTLVKGVPCDQLELDEIRTADAVELCRETPSKTLVMGDYVPTYPTNCGLLYWGSK